RSNTAAGHDRSATRRFRIAVTLFPLVVIANYLVMSLGLAPDRNSVTQTDELLHRPLVWAYFVVAVWVGGACYEVAIKPWFERSHFARTIVLTLLSGLLIVPFFLGKEVQVGPDWGKPLTNTSMPVGLYRCALFLREQSQRRDLIQDSGRDPDKALG